MKQLILHCGLHKTGTTAVQNFLTANRGALLRHGVLYPRAGTPENLTGQHNLAWELGRMRHFRTPFGTIDALFDEIGSFDGRVIVSSEDFETSILHPERWARLAGRAQAMGFEVLFVVYLRDVVPHLESVYLQKLRSGYGQEYGVAARTVMETGVLKYYDWEAVFDRRAMVRAIGAIPGARLLLRHYDTLSGGLSEADFREAVGIAHVDWDAPQLYIVNQRDPLAESLRAFLVARSPLLSGSAPGLADVIAALFEGQSVQLVTPPRLVDALRTRFMAPDEPRSQRPLAPGVRALNVTRVFSFETQVMFDDLLHLGNRTDLTEAQREVAQETMLRQWWAWIGVVD